MTAELLSSAGEGALLLPGFSQQHAPTITAQSPPSYLTASQPAAPDSKERHQVGRVCPWDTRNNIPLGH